MLARGSAWGYPTITTWCLCLHIMQCLGSHSYLFCTTKFTHKTVSEMEGAVEALDQAENKRGLVPALMCQSPL